MSTSSIGSDIPLNPNTPWQEIPALLLPAYAQTCSMVTLVMLMVVLLGGILGILLFNSSHRGLFPHAQRYALLSTLANLGRSLPFLVLMAAIIPFTKWLMGTTIGISAAIVPMTLAGIPFFARLIENSLNELPAEINAVGRASGGSALQIICSLQLYEALPSIVAAITLNFIAMIEYSAIAGSIGAGGIGYLAVLYGYQRFDHHVMIATIISLMVSIQLIQFLGHRISRALAKN
jgi:D-methionine transport system permease protein